MGPHIGSRPAAQAPRAWMGFGRVLIALVSPMALLFVLKALRTEPAPHGPTLGLTSAPLSIYSPRDVAATWPGRHLLSEATEKPVWEQCHVEQELSSSGFLFFYAAIVAWLFLGIALLADDYMVPFLEEISDALGLSDDVAGATFMAAGSSAPELFASFAGMSVESNVGVGAIVGSAAFNILVIISLSGLLAGSILTIDWRPLARDGTFYTLSLVLLVLFCWDGKLQWYEAVLLLASYAVYLVAMKYNGQIMAWLARHDAKILPQSSLVKNEHTSRLSFCLRVGHLFSAF